MEWYQKLLINILQLPTYEERIKALKCNNFFYYKYAWRLHDINGKELCYITDEAIYV